MVIRVRNSLTATIAKAMALILCLVLITTATTIFSVARNIDDAKAVNISGSMRMQSYRLAYDVKIDAKNLGEHVALFEQSLNSPSMRATLHWSVPEDIKQDYLRIKAHWEQIKPLLTSERQDEYLLQVTDFVEQINSFVFKLQRYSEQKLIKLAWIGGMGLCGILAVAIYLILYIRRKVVRPLGALVYASEQVQMGVFDVALNHSGTNELSILTRAFSSMAAELGKLYRSMESAVSEKTAELQNANRSLKVLYECSQELTAARINHDNLQTLLHHFTSLDGVCAAKLDIDEEGEPGEVLIEGNFTEETGVKALRLDNQHLGYLHWQCDTPFVEQSLIDSFVLLFSRAIYYNQAQRQAEKLLLMEERATIARELHDSLAQSLAYLKIQAALIKREVTRLNGAKTASLEQAVDEMGVGLTDAYTQLRELLTTFRLSIKEGSFAQALAGMMTQLNEQGDAVLSLDNTLSSLELDAHEQVHLIQLIREATLNAIKHANALHINIRCVEREDEVCVTISDDGDGFDLNSEKANHYGMNIMYERAERLGGRVSVESQLGKGTQITLCFPLTKDLKDDSE